MNATEKGRPQAIAVLGAGIVGAATALALAADGHAVTVIDRDLPGAGTSSGNAGGVVEGAIMPTATPEAIRALPGYLLDRHGAAVLRPSYALQILPWLVRFIAAARPRRVASIAAALQPLVSRAMQAHGTLAALAGAERRIQCVGWLKVYSSQAAYEKTAFQRQLMSRHGVRFTALNAAEVADLEPRLSRDAYDCGLMQPGSGFVNDPRGLVQAYLEAAVRQGAQFIQDRVNAVQPSGAGAVRVLCTQAERRFDAVVIATGAWSKQFASQVGDSVCLDTERGYHLSLASDDGPLLTRPVGFPEQDCVLSPMHDGLSIVSGDELAGLTAAPDFRRIRALLPFVRKVLPGTATQAVQREWMGHRPSTPDSLPVIGRSPKAGNVLYAFGHGHLGLTQSAITAQLIAGLVGGRPDPFDLTPYRIDRF